MRRPTRHHALLLGLALACAAVAHAGDEDAQTDRLREALRQTSARLQETQAQLEQAQLAAAEAQRERDALKQHASTPKDDARAAALQRQLASASGELAQARAEGQKSQQAQQAAERLAKAKETESAALSGQLEKLRTLVRQCAASDDALYGTGVEIAGLYRDPDFVNHLRNLHLHPLGFDRVKQENRMRDLEDRFADDHAKVERCRTAVAAGRASPAGAAQATPPPAGAAAQTDSGSAP